MFNKGVKTGRRISGQAAVEMIVGMTLLVPMFLVIALLAQYLEIQHKTHEASRYAAWERTLWAENTRTTEVSGNIVKSAQDLQGEVNALFFGSSRIPIHYKSARAKEAIAVNRLWRDHKGVSLLREVPKKGASNEYSETTGNTPANNVMDLMAPFEIEEIKVGLQAIRRKNFSQISVGRSLADLNLPLFGRLDRKQKRQSTAAKSGANDTPPKVLAMRSNSAILSQSWTATDEASMGKVINGMVLDGLILAGLGETMGYVIHEIVELIPFDNFPFKDLIPAYLNNTNLTPETQSLILPNYAIQGRTAPLKNIGVDVDDITKWI